MKKITLLIGLVLCSFTLTAQCDYQLELNDSFGDGWGGNSVDILVNGTIVLDDATLEDGEQGFETFSVSDGDEISITVDDSGSFDSEVSYRILDNVGQERASGNLTDVPEAFDAQCSDCTMQVEFTTMLVTDCDNDAFFIDVNITDLGTSTSFTITTEGDDEDDSVEVTEPGMTTVGPFDSGSTITVNLTSENDTCVIQSETTTFFCPPANDTCDTAEALGDGETVMVNTTGATEDEAGCMTSTTSKGVWYFFNDGGEEIAVEITTNGSDFDTELSLFQGDACNNLSCIENDDDGGDGNQSLISFTTNGLGLNYYILATGFGTNTGNLQVAITGEGLLSTEEMTSLDSFSLYPNPAQEALNISATTQVERIQVYNLAGQRVMERELNANTARIDVSNLKSGIYLLQVESQGQSTAYKFIKE